MNISPITTVKIKKVPAIIAGLFAFSIIVSSILYVNLAHAAATQALVRFDRMATSQATTGTVCLQPATTGTEATVVVKFPAGFNLGSAANFTVSTTNDAWPTGGTAWPGIATATGVTGQEVTFPSGDLTVGTLYCFNWTNTAAVTQPSGAGTSEMGLITTQTGASATLDEAGYATATVSNDQIVVTATVPQIFEFSLSGNTDPLGNLSTSSVKASPTPRTATVSTNAANGWQIWAKSANAGLASVQASYLIPSTAGNNTLSAGTEGYNTGVVATSQAGGSGSVTVDSNFAGGSLGKGGGLLAAFQSLASSDGTADTSVVTLTNNVAISSLTPSALDYTDTITVVGAGLF